MTTGEPQTPAEIYEQALVPALFGSWAPRVVALTTPVTGERVLDVACGTGAVARVAASLVGSPGTVLGLDLNPGMLTVAASVPRHTDGSAVIRWCEASAVMMPLADRSFEVVCCQLGLQFFPDRLEALREMHRILVPGGRLGVMVWRDLTFSPGFTVMADALARHVGPEAAAFMQTPFSLSSASELSQLLVTSGFRNVCVSAATGTVRFSSVRRFVRDYVAATPLARHVAAVSAAAWAALLDEIETSIRTYVVDGGLAFPIAAHLASGRKPEAT